jgi:hypothetical protein
MRTCGLIGTITAEMIEYDDGRSFRTVGGILYQAAVLCGGGTATARALLDGISPVPAAERGVALATRAVGISGLQETYDLAFRARTEAAE